MHDNFYWWKRPKTHTLRNRSHHRTRASATYSPLHKPAKLGGFWSVYWKKIAASTTFGAVGVVGFIYYGFDLSFLGMGAFLYFALFALAVLCALALPLHYWKQYRIIRAADAIPGADSEEVDQTH